MNEKINMINEKYIERISIDDEVIQRIRAIMKDKKITIKKLTEIDSSLDYGFLQQVFSGNKPVIAYSLIKSVCKCLNIDVAVIYDSCTKYN